MSDRDESNGPNPKTTRWRPFFFICAGLLVVWLVTPFVTEKMVGEKLEARGQAGDMFGSVNALFSGLALAGVIWALYLQMKELGYQREELRQTRETLKGQHEEQRRLAEAQEAQNEMERELARKRLTIAVFDEWNSDSLVAHRIDLRSLGNLVFRISADELWTKKWSRDDPHTCLAAIYRFFDKWARLSKFKQIDGELLGQLVGMEIHEWNPMGMVVPGDPDSPYSAALKDIEELVFYNPTSG